MNYVALLIVCMGAVLTFKQTDYKLIHYYVKVVSYNTTMVKNLVLENVKPNRTYRAFNCRYELLKDIDGDSFKVEFQDFFFTNNEFRKGAMLFSIKVCSMIKKNMFGSRLIFEHSNLTDCPMTKGYYELHNFNILDEQLPPYLPRGRWRLTFHLIYHTYSVALVEWYGAIRDRT